MVGLPGSGKSSWVVENTGDAVIVCPDDVRSHIFGHTFHGEAEGFVWAFCKAMTRMLLAQRKNVIFDCTAITRTHRNDILSLAMQEDAATRIIWIDTPLKMCLYRRRDGEKKIPESVILRMHERFEKPVKSEAVEVIRVKNKRSKT